MEAARIMVAGGQGDRYRVERARSMGVVEIEPVRASPAKKRITCDARTTGLPTVLPSHPHGMRVVADNAAAKAKIRLDVCFQADSFMVMKELVEIRTGLYPAALVVVQPGGGRRAAAACAAGKARGRALAHPRDPAGP